MFSGHASKDLAHQEAEGQTVVACSFAGSVKRLGPLERADHVVPVQHPIRVVDHLADVVEPGLVREHVADGDCLLAGLSEFGPVLGYAVLVV